MAYHLAADGCELLGLSVAYARQRGVPWDVLGGALGAACQTAREQYAGPVKQITEAIVMCWLLGDDARWANLPEAATNPADGVARLDRWARERLTVAELRSRCCPRSDRCCLRCDDPSGVAPVSCNLPGMDVREHCALVAAGTQVLRERLGGGGTGDPRGRQLELKLARQQAALLERLLLEEAAERGSGGDETGRLAALEQARAEMAETGLRAGGDPRRPGCPG